MADFMNMEVNLDKEDVLDVLSQRDECFKVSNVILRNQIAPNKTTFSPTGSPTSDTYGLHYEAGKESLVVTGTTDNYSKVQASLEDTKIYNILNRYTNGDVEALSRTKGQYFDSTKLPSSLAEAQHHLMNVSKHFDSLPDSVKRQYNYSVTEYVEKIANGGVPYVTQLLNNNVTPQTPAPAPEVKVEVKESVK